VDRELERLTALAAQGGADIPTVLAALRTRQERRGGAGDCGRSAPGAVCAIEAQLRARVKDWRALLRRNVGNARPVIQTLLAGRIAVTPQALDMPKTAPVFDVKIPLTTRGLFAGLAEIAPETADLQHWRPHRVPTLVGGCRSDPGIPSCPRVELHWRSPPGPREPDVRLPRKSSRKTPLTRGPHSPKQDPGFGVESRNAAAWEPAW
jgi:hypothetical protein